MEKPKNQIDHIMISKKHRNAISNLRSYRCADADTDHYLLIAQFKIRLSLRWKRSSKNNNSRLNVERLRDQEIARHYEKLIWNELKNNKVQNTVEDIDNQWSRIKQIIIDSAIGKQK